MQQFIENKTIHSTNCNITLRIMDRRIPRVNRILEQKWNEKCIANHKSKLSHIKSVCDSSPPKAYKAKPRDLK